MHRTNCHEGLSVNNPNDMVCMFNTYLELASNNNTDESLAFVVADIAFKVAVMTSSVANISFFVAEITFKVLVITSSVIKVTLVDRDHFLSG